MKNKDSQSPKRRALELIKNLDDDISMQELHKSVSDLHKKVWKNPIPKIVFIVTGLLAFTTLIYFIISNYDCSGRFHIADSTKIGESKNKIILLDYLLYAFWAIIPPSYFLWEYLSIFPYKLESDQFADLKYTQELSSKIWAALLFIFGIILYNKYGFK